MPYYLEGSIAEELGFNFRDLFPERCGLALAFGLPTASHDVLDCLIAMELRGEAAAGLISVKGSNFYPRRRVGPVSFQFRDFDDKRCRKEFPGDVAFGHNRYATKGDSKSPYNVQPFYVRESKYGPFAIAHNGTLVNTEEVKKQILRGGAPVMSTSDTEIIIHLILQSRKKTIEEAILYALEKVKVAYSFIIVTKDKAFAIRDKYGVRPLSIAKVGKGYLVCSETVAFNQFPKAEYWKDVGQGEMVVFEKEKEPYGIQYTKPVPRSCIFEAIYFMNPRSRINGWYVEDIRQLIGQKMGAKIRKQVMSIEDGITKKDVIVIPILDSGKFFAQGLAKGLKVEYLEAFARMRNPRADIQDRSFTAPSTKERLKVILKKLHLREDLVKDKIVVVADDSIVRANTSKIIVKMLKAAGARKVIFVAGFPPIINPCHNGMDFQTRKQLAAYSRTIRQIRKVIKADRLFYLYKGVIFYVAREVIKCGVCGACFHGKYPVRPRKFDDF